MWEGGPGRKTSSPKIDRRSTWASFVPSLLFARQTVKLVHGGKHFILWTSIKFWICLSAGVKVGKLRSENGEASWVRVGWGGWVWQTWESCPAANKLVSTLILIPGISEYLHVIFFLSRFNFLILLEWLVGVYDDCPCVLRWSIE